MPVLTEIYNWVISLTTISNLYLQTCLKYCQYLILYRFLCFLDFEIVASVAEVSQKFSFIYKLLVGNTSRRCSFAIGRVKFLNELQPVAVKIEVHFTQNHWCSIFLSILVCRRNKYTEQSDKLRSFFFSKAAYI